MRPALFELNRSNKGWTPETHEERDMNLDQGKTDKTEGKRSRFLYENGVLYFSKKTERRIYFFAVVALGLWFVLGKALSFVK